MDSSQLNRQQLDVLTLRLGAMLRYLHALQERMRDRGFPTDDPLVRATSDAADKLRSLLSAIHVLAVTLQESQGFFVGYRLHRRGKDDRRC